MSKRLVSILVLISILAASLAACSTATEAPAETAVAPKTEVAVEATEVAATVLNNF